MLQRIRLPSFSLYEAGLVLLLAIGWLLPNHYKPWNTFHSNAWIGCVLLMVAWRQCALAGGAFALSRSAVVLLLVSLIPWAQHLHGQLPLRDDALVNALYILGVALAYIVGRHWARHQPDAPYDFLLGAAAAAALAQVGMQLYQWLGYNSEPDLMDIWVLPFVDGRPYGNLGQPNQLASLLLWGMLGCVWAWSRKLARAPLLILVGLLLCYGTALTSSRTAFLSMTLAVLGVSFAPARALRTSVRRVFQSLYGFYLLVFLGLSTWGGYLRSGAAQLLLDDGSSVTRLALFRMAIDGANQHPWLGWGWNKTNEAFLDVYPRHPALSEVYVQESHNLVLDLAIWVGWPLALLLTGASLWWLWRSIRAVAGIRHVLGLAALGVLLVHAMLEFPLHYAYFLWPFAMMAGAVGATWEPDLRLTVPRWLMAAVLAALTVTGGIIVVDYMRIEEAFRELRFQLRRIGSGHDERPPAVILLKDWRDFFIMMREMPKPGMPDAQIDNWRNQLLYNTAPLPMRRLIGALELNGRHEEAAYWADRSCSLLDRPKCTRMLDEWTKPSASATESVDEPVLTGRMIVSAIKK